MKKKYVIQCSKPGSRPVFYYATQDTLTSVVGTLLDSGYVVVVDSLNVLTESPS